MLKRSFGRGQVQGGERPRLPWGDASKYQWKPPAEGRHLVGWAVMAYFPTDDKWYTGVVVRHVGDSSYIIFYEEDSVHERWDLPDDEIVFRCVSAGSYQVLSRTRVV